MYRKNHITKTSLKVNKAYTAQPIEQVVQRLLNNKEPINQSATPLYQHRAEGINPDYDIRTDRWEHAIDALDRQTASQRAKRQESIDKLIAAQKGESKESGTNNSAAESTQGTT